MENVLVKKSSNLSVLAMINNQLFKHRLFSVVWILMFILTSCTPEYFIVKNFKASNNISVLVIPNQVILKTNSKIIDLYPEFNKLPKALQDTIWNVNTQFLEKKSDSTIINQFYSTFIQLMQSTEVKVYSFNEIDKFNAADTNAYVLKIVQMEMDENVKKSRILNLLITIAKCTKKLKLKHFHSMFGLNSQKP